MKINKYFGYAVFLILPIFLFAGVTFAQQTNINQAVSYLRSAQNTDGSWEGWPDGMVSSFQATAEVADSLHSMEGTADIRGLAVNWLAGQNEETANYLFCKTVVLAQAGYDVSSLVTGLISYQNSDGSFGGYLEYAGNVSDTALSLRALKSAGYGNQQTIATALTYLTSQQNADGGWGYGAQNSSQVYLTSQVILALADYRQSYDVEAALSRGATFIMSQQLSNGGFGGAQDGGAGSVVETALAFRALSAAVYGANGIEVPTPTDLSVVAPQAIAYLVNTQNVDGSWDQDAYSTALAARALGLNRADLKITATDISISKLTPTIGDVVTISATVHNKGMIAAENVTVRFYTGDPNNGGVQIGADQIISQVAAYSNMQASVQWTADKAGTAIRICAVLDPQNAISELDEANNQASAYINPALLADLDIVELSPSAYTIDDGGQVSLSINIANRGETAVEDIIMRLYDGVVTNETELARFLINLNPGAADSLQANFSLHGPGRHTILVTAATLLVTDHPRDLVFDSNLNNNFASIYIQVNPVTDLNVFNVSFSSAAPNAGDIVNISAQVGSSRATGASNVQVAFYDGDPVWGGTLIGITTLSNLAGNSNSTVTLAWDTVGKSGAHDIFVVVDPQNAVAEPNEADNKISAAIQVKYPGQTEPADITLSYQDITFTPATPNIGDVVAVNATIYNPTTTYNL